MATPARARPVWARFLAGPLIGTAYFWVVYLAAEAACADGLHLLGTSALRAVIVASTAAAVAAAVASARAANRLRRDGAKTGEDDGARTGDDDGSEADRDNRRFMGATGLVLLGLFAFFVALLAAPVVGSTLC